MDPRSELLLDWYAQHKRDLPWRDIRDAYRIFMSELMLQQTQVERVKELYRRWLECFPDWKALADASTSDLIHAWAGLGYNRRALYAREAAKQVVAHGVPRTETEWRALKGVGPYMAAALAEFANHERAVVIDTNIRRVAGRIFLGKTYPEFTDDKEIRKALEAATPTDGAHWDLPQAFMDFANAVCLPRLPSCEICPLKERCLGKPIFDAYRENPDLLKTARKTRKPVETIREGKKFPDRIYRGRILATLREFGEMPLAHIGARIDPTYEVRDQEWIEAMARRLEKDGLIRIDETQILRLPKG